MIDFSDKTQLISFIAIMAVILCLLALSVVVAARMKKRLSGGAFAVGLTVAILVLVFSIGACLTSIAYKTEFLRIDSAVEGNALAFQYDGETVFTIPYLGVFFGVVFEKVSVELLVYVATLIDLALLVFLCVRRSITRTLYDVGEDGEGYYTVGDDEPGAFAASDAPAPVAEPVAETYSSSEKPSETPEIMAEEAPEKTEETVIEKTAAFVAPEPIEGAETPIATDVTEGAETPIATDETEGAETPIATDVTEGAETPVVTDVTEKPEETEPSDEYKPDSAEDILDRMIAQSVGDEPGAQAAVAHEKPVAYVRVVPEKKPKRVVRKVVAPIKPDAEVRTESEKTAELADEKREPYKAAALPEEKTATEEKPLPEKTAKKNGRATVKSRAAAMFDEYLNERSAEEREKLLGSIDVITKNSD